MNASTQINTLGNISLFRRAFKECGIGGRFSKFQLAEVGKWFLLTDFLTGERTAYCYRVHDAVKRSQFEAVSSTFARNLFPNSDWVTHIHTAQKVIARIVNPHPAGDLGDTMYYHDSVNGSIYVANRMFILEVTSIIRDLPQVSSNAVFNFLDTRKAVVSERDSVKVYSEFDNVHVRLYDIVSGGSTTCVSDLDPVEFEKRFGE